MGTVVLVLSCWFCLGLGVLIGHFIWPRRTDTPAPAPAPAPEPVSTAPRGAHHGPPTSEFALPSNGYYQLLTPELPQPDQFLRRQDDRPDVPPAPPRPGGRRRSDGPPMTRQQVRELREKGWYGEDPASPEG